MALATAVALSVVPGSVAAATPPDPADPANPLVEPGLANKVAAGGTVRVNVVTEDRADLPAAMAATGEVLQRYVNFPVVTLRADRAALDSLRRQPGVVSISEDKAVPPTLDESTALIGADRTRVAGHTGEGTAVAILDTGVDVLHPFLFPRVVAQACFSTNDEDEQVTSLCPNGSERQTGPGTADVQNPEAPCARDDLRGECEHGTHVAGIAAGNGGVAPRAEIIAVQVFSRHNSSDDCGDAGPPCVLSFASDQLAGLDWIYGLTTKDGKSIAAANLSLGSGRHIGDCDGDSLKEAIDRLREAGVATVISAGNDGHLDAVGSPACISTAITVGSTTDADDISNFSNRGSLLDVFAPGDDITSSVPGVPRGTNKQESFDGTSMAAPHVAGAFAVLRQVFGRAPSVGSLEGKIENAGRPISYQSDGKTVTTPRLQLDTAVGMKTPAKTLADFDLDGKADVLARDAAGDLYLYPGNGASGFKPRYRVGTGFGGMNALISADFTLDGRADLLTRKTSTGELRLYAHSGNPATPFTGHGTVVGTGFGPMTALVPGDFNLDGRIDLLTRTAAGQLRLYDHTGNPATPFTGDGTGVGTGFDTMNALVAGDFTMDGKPDLLTRRTSNGELLLFTHSGNPTLPLRRAGTRVGTGASLNALLARDFNNDGRTDLVTRRTSTGELLLFANTGRRADPFIGHGTVIGTGWDDMFLG
ncbi:S8 family serine peptidase [Nonomuraea sp. NN258]|uniref:S8 family serine peptidase n=1 Tax=Nonomuraea antri TaxID=2730852 RepID=UPI00156A01D9|nr:S8 family serine peptidase [Nonomuraea antri]NRQ33701.1 S8 family serine peptidase [Nonomuraea antri]